MGSTATIFRFCIELSDIDRGNYETLDLRVAQHPSEEEDRMVLRVLARALAYGSGLEFGRGLSNPEEPAMWSFGLTGQVNYWIDVGLPSAERLHKASKASEHVLVFTDRPVDALVKEWRRRRIHASETIRVHRFPAEFIEALAAQIERRCTWYVTVQDHELTVQTDDRILSCHVEESSLDKLCGGMSAD
ncbi:MAG: YaeQ family protein [Planctomycetes bacterium]|nr:YaeQ family protein [Planctomycetota bacterium]